MVPAQALTTGHEGSLSTVHASSPADAIRRLTTLALMGDIDLPYRAVADQVASAVDLVVHQARLADGARRVVEIAAVAPGASGAEIAPLVRWSAGTGSFVETAALAAWRAGLRDQACPGTV
jgi:pilus assembly protein CpaF